MASQNRFARAVQHFGRVERAVIERTENLGIGFEAFARTWNLRGKKSRWLLVSETAETGVALAENEPSAARAVKISSRRATTILTRLYARSIGGARTAESVPRNYGSSTFMISTMGCRWTEATMLIEGSVDTAVFNA